MGHLYDAAGRTELQDQADRSEAGRLTIAAVVVSGTGRVTVDEKVVLLAPNESTYVPVGAKHRLENPGRVPLTLIEVQCGDYVGEDDIVRFDDIYGRASPAGAAPA